MKQKKKRANMYDPEYIMRRDKCTMEEAIEKVKDLKRRTSVRTKPFKRSNPYDPEYIMGRDKCTMEEAIEKVKDLKIVTAGNKDNFLRRHGKEGLKKFEEFRGKSAVSLENMVRVHGPENGLAVYNNYLSTRDSMSEEFFRANYGDNWKGARKKRLDSVKVNYEYFLNKYGDEKTATEEYRKLLVRRTKPMLDSSPKVASEEAIKFFQPIVEFLEEQNEEYTIGGAGKSEFKLFDKHRKRHYYYDFCVPKIKLIVEYHGFTHFDPKADDYDTWRAPFGGSAISSIMYDRDKRQLAESQGYKVEEVYYQRINDSTIGKLISMIKECLYENKIN